MKVQISIKSTIFGKTKIYLTREFFVDKKLKITWQKLMLFGLLMEVTLNLQIVSSILSCNSFNSMRDNILKQPEKKVNNS